MSGGRPWLSLGLVAAALAIGAAPGLGAALDWRPGAAPWRLLTCQLTHWDAGQLGWDAFAMVILGAWAESRWPAQARRGLVAGLLLVPAVVAAVHPWLAFRGLSGLACALAAGGALAAWQEARVGRDLLAEGVAGALLGGLLAKIAYELATGATVFVDAAGWRPLPLAHLAGACAGLLAAAQPPACWRRQAWGDSPVARLSASPRRVAEA